MGASTHSWLKDADRRLQERGAGSARTLDLFIPEPARSERRSSSFVGTPGTGRLADYLHRRAQVSASLSSGRDRIARNRIAFAVSVTGLTLIAVLYRYLVLENLF